MGLEPLNEGLRLYDCLCVDEEGRDTPTMVSRESSASTSATVVCESAAAVACESSAVTSATVACESAAPVACESCE
jgi:hypothetical protein